jgi:hypothetical protein
MKDELLLPHITASLIMKWRITNLDIRIYKIKGKNSKRKHSSYSGGGEL